LIGNEFAQPKRTDLVSGMSFIMLDCQLPISEHEPVRAKATPVVIMGSVNGGMISYIVVRKAQPRVGMMSPASFFVNVNREPLLRQPKDLKIFVRPVGKNVEEVPEEVTLKPLVQSTAA
jgi:hypothetical protein